MKKQSGTARICEVMISNSLLHCKVNSINSIVEKMKQITGEKFPITKYSGTDYPVEDPWIVELLIGDTKVIVKFTMNENHFINKIEVEE